MKNGIVKNWRDAATLIVLSRSHREVSRCRDRCNYDVLLQTRTQKATFKNSVVFPGGVTEAADASPQWLRLLSSFGYTQADFDAFHRSGATVTPLFQNNPVERHIALRITAIRETFEELGLLICSSAHKKDRDSVWASEVSGIDVKDWQSRVSKNPEELLNLCKELNCYPDIWSLSYWSNWHSPTWIKKRFNTGFFVTAFNSKPTVIKGNTEVAKVEWLSPAEILEKSSDPNILLFPPQSYELNRLQHFTDLEELVKFAKERTEYNTDIYYHAEVQAKDGRLLVLPGDDLYPTAVDLNELSLTKSDKTVSELRESSKSAHRFEFKDSKTNIVLKNFKPDIDMGDRVIPVNIVVS